MPPLARGDVYRLEFAAQDPARIGQMIPKWVVLLQGGHYWQMWPSRLVAVATSQPPIVAYPHFVRVNPGLPGGFDVESWIDCGDLLRIPRAQFTTARYKGHLSANAIGRIDDALQIGTGVLDGDTFLSLGP